MNSPLERLLEEGATYFDEGDFGRARLIFAEAVRLAEARGPRARELVAPLMWLAKATGELIEGPSGEIEQQLAIERSAIAIAEEALADDAWLPHYLHMHAVTLWRAKYHRDAETVLSRALDVALSTRVDSSFYEGTLAVLLLDLARPDEALVYARRSLREAEGGNEDVMGLYRLGLCLKETGPNDEARATLERFLAACPEADPELRERVHGWIRDLGQAPPRQ
jgi:tetratricopeptide (TPR) repeat protein